MLACQSQRRAQNNAEKDPNEVLVEKEVHFLLDAETSPTAPSRLCVAPRSDPYAAIVDAKPSALAHPVQEPPVACRAPYRRQYLVADAASISHKIHPPPLVPADLTEDVAA